MSSRLLSTSWQPGTLDKRPWVFQAAASAAAVLIGILVAAILLRQPIAAFGVALLPIFVLMVRYPRQTFYVYVLIYPFVVNLRRDISPVPFLKVNEVLIAILFAGVVLHGLLHWPWRVSFDLIDYGLLLWLLTSTVIPFVVVQARGQELSSAGVNELLGPIKHFLLYRIARAVIQKREHVVRLLQLCLISSVLVSLIAIIQNPDLFNSREILHTYYLNDNEQVYIDSPWRDEDLYRVGSTLGNYNTLGGYLGIMLIIGIFFTQSYRSIKSLLWITPVVAINGVALILSGNTAGLFALIGSVVIGALCLRGLPRAVLPLLVGLVITATFFSTFILLRLDQQFNNKGKSVVVSSSLSGRVSLWERELLPALNGNYVLGVGPELPDEVWQSTEESQYLYLLFKGGILYLSGYLVWTSLVLVTAWRARRSPDRLARMLALTSALIAIALLAMGVSNAYITYTALMTDVWIVLAAVGTAHLWAKRDAESTTQECYA